MIPSHTRLFTHAPRAHHPCMSTPCTHPCIHPLPSPFRFPSDNSRVRFDVYVCTAAERPYALEAWRLLDPGATMIPAQELSSRVVAGMKHKNLRKALRLVGCCPPGVRVGGVLYVDVDVWMCARDFVWVCCYLCRFVLHMMSSYSVFFLYFF